MTPRNPRRHRVAQVHELWLKPLMLRKILLLLAVILFFAALGLGITAHALFIAGGVIDATVIGLAAGALMSIVIAGVIVKRTTRDKPIDMTNAVSYDLQSVMLGGLLAGFGVLVLALFTPLMYDLFEKEAERPGSGASINDLPAAIQPALNWLNATLGSIGLVLPVAVFGLLLIIIGWRFIRPARR